MSFHDLTGLFISFLVGLVGGYLIEKLSQIFGKPNRGKGLER